MTTETPKTADAAPTGAGGGSAAGTADLNSLLGEWSQDGKPDKTPTPDVLKQLAPVIEFATTEMTNRAKEGLNKDLQAAIGYVKEDEAAKDYPDKIVRGLLEVHAAEDPSFAKAFENRSKDQKAWQAKLTEARAAVANELKGLQSTSRVSSDVLAARASVSGSSSTPPDSAFNPVEAFGWSDQRWKQHLDAEIAKARR